MNLIRNILFAPLPQKFVAGILVFVWWLTANLLPSHIAYPESGSKDFIQYWSAYQVIKDGGNPYDPAQMLEVQKTVGLTQRYPIMFWSPPWFISLAKPVLNNEFPSAAALWMRVSIAIYLVCVWIGTKSYLRRANGLGLLIPLLFAPFLDCLNMGQSSTVLALPIALFLLVWSNSSKSPYLLHFVFGCSLPLLLLKPHLFIVFVAALIAVFITRRRRIPNLMPLLIGCFTTILVFLWNIILLPAPTIHGWINSLALSDNFSTVNARLDWVTPTFAGIFRIALSDLNKTTDPTPDAWPTFLTPIIGIIISYCLIIKRDSLKCPELLGAAIAISLLFAPYGWHYDLVLLIAPITASICSTTSIYRASPLIFSIVLARALMHFATAQHEFIVETLMLFAAFCATAFKNEFRKNVNPRLACEAKRD